MKQWCTVLMLLTFLFSTGGVAQAAVSTKACAKYQKYDGSWSPAYRVRGFIISGKELNTQTKTSFYEEGLHYYLITWRSGDFTIFPLRASQHRLTSAHQAYHDTEGKLWHVHAGWNPCN